MSRFRMGRRPIAAEVPSWDELGLRATAAEARTSAVAAAGKSARCDGGGGRMGGEVSPWQAGGGCLGSGEGAGGRQEGDRGARSEQAASAWAAEEEARLVGLGQAAASGGERVSGVVEARRCG
ncbi:hypothetical protein PVAP13_7KG273610 [Panicum virgatum]|uniref:Uncharacterized protein n=1 Tax=Panicum virgatum TaxID=38727 RepID=A0A8T0QNZ4_PANVG|nr:hypothetical protein PVAP13_7KG273610 [Panicum virgatum]